MDEQTKTNPADDAVHSPVPENLEMTEPASTAPVMDIKPSEEPPQVVSEPESATPSIDPVVAPPLAEPAASSETPELATETPSEAAATPSAEDHHSATAPASSHPGKNTKLIIIAAIVIALIVALVAIYAYMNQNKNKPAINSAANTQQQTASTQKVTAADVGQTSKDVDSALTKADSSQDVGSTDLNDNSLGL